MKKTALHAALFALTLPMSLYGLGLGEMKVDSSLDQPFIAEIELMDVSSDLLSEVKVGLADPENFARVGIERIAILDLLNFTVTKNANGKYVIKIVSQERMTEPYMEIVVDVAWPDGQLYKAYTVLLDPPGYQLVSSTAVSSPTHYTHQSAGHAQAGVVNKTVISHVENVQINHNDSRNKSTYGPTVPNENIWQIAQRYKTSEVILAQVVIAIVGANPDAFTDGNLNGLKVGARLTIPATKEIMQVPPDLASEEVAAHDKAWNEKTSIKHAMALPYTGGAPVIQPQPMKEQQVLNSEIPAVPHVGTSSIPSTGTAQLINANSAVHIDNQTQSNQNTKAQQNEEDSTAKAEIAITTAAIESVRESNALLMEQLHLLQDQNKTLQKQLAKRDKDMELMRTQMQVIMKERLSAAAQTSTPPEEEGSSSYVWPFLFLLLIAAGGGGYAFWFFKRKEDEVDDAYPISTPLAPTPKSTEDEPPTIQKMESSFAPLLTAMPEEASNSSELEPVPQEEQPVELPEEIPQPEELPKELPPEELPSTPIELPPTPEEIPEEHAEVRITPELTVPAEREEDSIEMTLESLSSTEETISISNNEAEVDFFKAIDIPVTDEKPAHLKSNTLQTVDEEPLEAIEFSATPTPEVVETTSVLSEAESVDDGEPLLEFESGLHQNVDEKTNNIATEDDPNQLEGIDFVSSWTPESSRTIINIDNQPPVNLELDSTVTDFFSDSAESSETEAKTETEVPAASKEIQEESAFLADFTDSVNQEEPIAIEMAAEEASEDTETPPLVKSEKAFDTLLALAKTYIGMDDFDSAQPALEEIVQYGSATQKEEAARLLDEIKNK